MNRKLFFEEIKPIFGGRFNQSQVDGLNNILDYYENQSLVNLKQFSHILATIHHETDKTFQPIREYGRGRGKPYGINVDVDKKPYFDTNMIFYGRGYTQNTWRTIYIKLTKANKFGWDFFNNPDLLLQHEPSIWATFYSMKTGLYTGKKLDDYDFFNDSSIETNKNSSIFGLPKWYNSRRIVNGLDKAKEIGDLTRIYYKALTT